MLRIFALVVLLVASLSSASANSFFETADNEDAEILEKLESLASKKTTNITPGTKISICRIKGIRTRCFEDSGSFVAERAFPVMPGRLFRHIQSGNDEPRNAFLYDREEFWRRIRAYKFPRAERLVNPIEHGSANFEEIIWVDVERDPDAAEVYRVWQEIAEFAKGRTLDRSGFAMIQTTGQSDTSSLQACWLFFQKNDPFTSKCTAVVAKSKGRTYVRFIKGYYAGGYAYEQPNRFECRIESGVNVEHAVSQVVQAITDALAGQPYRVKLQDQQGDKVQKTALYFNSAFEPSEIYPSYRELLEVFITVAGSDNSPKEYEFSFRHTVLLTKQNAGDPSQVAMPTPEQRKYYNDRLVEFFLARQSCKPAKSFFGR